MTRRPQQSFRARLTPKPWRVELVAPHLNYPWRSAEAEAAAREWQTRYAAACQGYATCRLVDVIGNRSVPADLASIVEVHDHHVLAETDLPLA